VGDQWRCVSGVNGGWLWIPIDVAELSNAGS
jgi:hypothetical protein